MSSQWVVKGLHHITLVTKNQEVNGRFYTSILGLRRVKLTVNQDDIYHRHLFYADENGTPGSAITFFEWPELTRGKVGISSPHHLSYEPLKLDSIIKWKLWLLSNGVPVKGPFIRDGRVSIYLRDPDGVIIEITKKNDEQIDEMYLKEVELKAEKPSGISEDMRLLRFNHASPVASNKDILIKFFEKVLRLKASYTKGYNEQTKTLIVGIGNDESKDFLRYLVSEDADYGLVGIGNVHHIAVMVDDNEEQRMIMRRLDSLGIRHSGIIDRFWFKSLYFRDPEGNLLEVATKGPGYALDEPPNMLGTTLALPAWLEPRRAEIEMKLRELDSQNIPVWPPSYMALPEDPEGTLSV